MLLTQNGGKKSLSSSKDTYDYRKRPIRLHKNSIITNICTMSDPRWFVSRLSALWLRELISTSRWSTLPSAQHLGQVNRWPLCLYYAVQLYPDNSMRCICIVFLLSVCQVVFSQRFIEEGNFRNRKRGKTSNIQDMHTIFNIRDFYIAYRNEIRTLINLITVISVCVFCFLRLRDSSWITCSKW